MVNYNNGKIYVIKSDESDEVYIGSTCGTLTKRFGIHKSNHKRSLRGEKFHQSCSGKILKYADARIELIENFPCETKRQLLDREGYFIKNTPKSINIIIQGRTMKQYRIDNAEKLIQQSKEYRENNKDILKDKYKEWYNSDKGKEYLEKRKAKINIKIPCPICGIEVSKSNLSRHQKSKNCNN